MRILHMSMDYPPRHAGGTTVHTYQLAHSLQKLGHEVSIIAASARGAPATQDDDGVMVHRVPRPYTQFSARKARELMGTTDVVHGHGICAYGMLKGAHPPTVVKLHNIWAQELEAYRNLSDSTSWHYVNISIPKYVRMDRATCSRANHLISISRYISGGAEDYGISPDKISLIPNGVDFERFERAEPAELKLKRPVIVYIGRLSPHKNVSALIKAVKGLKKGSLLVIGGGPSERELREEAGVLGKRVMFTGVVPFDEVPSYYKAADIVVYPTLYEPLGNVILEGMASGKPVVASRTGGIPEILPEKAGRLFSTGEELIDILTELAGDRALREQMGAHGTAPGWMSPGRPPTSSRRRLTGRDPPEERAQVRLRRDFVRRLSSR